MRRLISAVLALLVTACSNPVPPAASGDAIVYVIQRDWHTDIGLPVDEIAGPLTALKESLPGVRFLTFGFGERQFLISREVNVAAMLAALLPSQSALLMTALSATPERAFGSRNVVVLRLSRAGLDRIEAAIWHEFEQSPAGEPIRLADGPYPGSVFYAARDTYDVLFTCNTWSAETLREGGLAVPAAGILFSGQVMGSARWISTQQAATTP
jgi:uncharacterized protein (TIGR02117 family)